MSVTLYRERDAADVIKSKVLKWEDYLGLSEETHCNHKGLYHKKSGGCRVQVKGNMVMSIGRNLKMLHCRL